MNTPAMARVLGAAFLLQAVTSLISGLILKAALIEPGDIGATMTNIANNVWLMRANIFGELATAAGIVFLGAMLFVRLRKQNEAMALVALGLYILEASLLAASRIAAFSLLRTSQEYVAAGRPAYLETMGSLAFESMNFGYTLLMLPFSLGAVLFYYLLYRSGAIPRALSAWGLISVSVVLAASLSAILGHEAPFVVYLPYVPFEFAVGAWLLAKGMSDQSPARTAALVHREAATSPRSARTAP